MKTLIVAAALMLATPVAGQARAETVHAEPRDIWFGTLTALCGQRFEGRVVSTDAADADFAGQRLTMFVRDCSTDEIRIPFAVGDDRSRTWVITRVGEGLRLKHDHRGTDGRPEGLHWYGGVTTSPGTAERQDFPVDAFSVELFKAWDASVSTTNVWAVEVHPGRMFAYELRRANRHFRVEFDLTRPITD